MDEEEEDSMQMEDEEEVEKITATSYYFHGLPALRHLIWLL